MKLPALAAMLVLTAGFGAEAFAQDGMLVLKARRWQAEMDGTLQVDDDGIAGTEIDFQDTFGIEDKENFNELHLTIGFLGKMNLQYLTGKFEGSDTVTQDVRFGDVVFTVGTEVDTKVEFDLYTALWQIGVTLPVFPGVSVGLGGQVGIKYLDIAAESHDSFGNREEGELQAPFPVIGGYARAGLGFASIELQIHGIKIPDSFGLDGEALFFDATIALDVKIAIVFAGVGYRMLHLDVDYGGDDDESDFAADFDVDGLFFEAGIAF